MISKKHVNVEFVKDASQVDDSTPNIKMVGSNSCVFSKIGVSQFNDACEDITRGKCYVFDITVPESAQAAMDLDLEVEGVPTHFVLGEDGKKDTIVGMRPQEALKEAFKSSGIDFD